MLRVYLIYCLSGFVSLGYQVAWFRIYADRFGSTNLTFGLVLCNFIGGLGAGALASRAIADRITRHVKQRDPLRTYGVVEILVGLTVLLTIFARLPADTWGTFPYVLEDGIWTRTAAYQWSQVVAGGLSVFIPCFFMGVTFPLLCHVFRRDGRFPSALYAWNTLGACSGVLLCQAVLLPRLGHDATLWAMAALNLALGAFFVFTGGAPDTDADKVAEPTATNAAEPTGQLRFLMTCAVLSGLLAGGIEGDMIKRVWFLGGTSSAAMSLVSFWAILAIFLASTLVRVLRGMTLTYVKVAYGLAFVAYWAAWHWAYPILNTIDPSLGFGRLLAFIGVIVFPAFFCLSLLLPYVLNRIQATRRHLGLAYGANTVAFCIGMVGFTWIAPGVNIFYSLKLAMVLLVVGAVLLTIITEHKPNAMWKPVGALALFGVGSAMTSADFDPTTLPPHNPAAHFPVRAMKSNGAHTTYIVEEPFGDTLCFDSHPMSATYLSAQTYMRLMAHFGLLAHPNPKHALLICYGVGNTASAIASHTTIERLDVVDLNRKVIETAPEFAEMTNNVHLDPRVRFINDDGRTFLRVTDQKYDLVTSEPPPPMAQGIYRLYSREYYEQVLEHLTPNGLMTQWLPIYQMPREATALAVATFIDAFPHTLLFTGRELEFILIGSPAPIDLASIERRFGEQETVLRDLRRIGIEDSMSILARIVAGDATLRREYGDHPVISDQRDDFAFIVDLSDEAVIEYDPIAMLSDIDAQSLASYDRLQSIVTHLGRLQYHVYEFPTSSLATVSETGAQGVQLADVDWRRVRYILSRGDLGRPPLRPDEEVAMLEQALAIAYDQPRVLLRLATALVDRGDIANALPPLTRFRELEPDAAPGYVLEARIHLSQNEPGLARGLLKRALVLQPGTGEVHLMLANILRGDGDLGAAVTHYEAAAQLLPESARAQYELGYGYSLLGRGDEALERFVVAADLAPDWPVALNGAARMLATTQNTDSRNPAEAIRLAERAAEKTGRQDPTILDTLSLAYASAGRRKKAIKTAEQALALAEGRADKLAQQIRARLEAWRQ